MSVIRKRFGQHFLVDENVIAQIIRAIGENEKRTTIEIGPGKGALTIPLLEKLGKLEVVEIDRDLSAELKKKCEKIGQMNVHQQDALNTDFSAFSSSKITVVGNLPYNISTPLIFHLLKFANIKQMLFMLQKEVVDRICAKANSSDYGRLSVMVQAQCSTEKLFEISPAAFEPAPKVDSAVIKLVTTAELSNKINSYDDFSELVRVAFSYRRKMISNSLKQLINSEQLYKLNISPKARPGELSVDDYIYLANTLTESRETS